MEYFCKACLNHKQHTKFVKWIRGGKAKACRCDNCHDTELMRERQEEEAAAKAKYIAANEPLPLVSSKRQTLDDAKRRAVRRRIEELKESLEYDDYDL